VAENRASGDRRTPPAGWQDWQRWVEGVDWPDWRSWLKQIASTDWATGAWPRTGWEQSPQAGEIPLLLQAWEEDEPGDQVGRHLAQVWPAFRRWWREGANARPSAGEARAALEEHMPELVPAWERLTAMLPDDADASPRWRCGTRRRS